MRKKLKDELSYLIKNNLRGYILIIGVFLSGFMLSYALKSSVGAEEEIKHYIEDFLTSVRNYSTDFNTTFRLAMLGYVESLVILYFLSLSVLGSAGTLVFVFLKGFSYGIVLISSFAVVGNSAIGLFFCLILPHVIISLPCFLGYSHHCFMNAYSVLKGVKDFKKRVLMPLVLGVVSLGFLSVAALIQAYFEPILTRAIL